MKQAVSVLQVPQIYLLCGRKGVTLDLSSLGYVKEFRLKCLPLYDFTVPVTYNIIGTMCLHKNTFLFCYTVVSQHS